MELALILLKQVVIMLILICIGALCFKKRLITEEGRKSLSNIVLYIVNPIVVIVSYQTDFSYYYLKGLLYTIALSAVGFGIFILLSYVFIRKRKGSGKQNVAIERANSIYSNCGFMGIPLALALFQSEGVLYITAINTVFNILIWTHGVLMISGDKKQVSFKKIALNPTIIATVLGFVLFVFDIKIPQIPLEALNYIGDTITPLAMLVAGATIADANLLSALLKPRTYLVAALKLLIIPIAVIFVFKLIPCVNPIAQTTAVLGLSCPSATISTMLAIKFDKNAFYSSELFGFTTIISIVTMPFVIFLTGII